MDIIEAIRQRRSVRSYDGRGLDDSQRRLITDAIYGATAPFEGRTVVKLISVSDHGDFRPSTYGVISGARDYIVAGIADDRLSALRAGYMLEQVVLAATCAGLGTCWIAGTFKHRTFEQRADMPDDAPLRIVIPVGVAAAKSGMIDSLTRRLAGSDHRKPMDKLFFSHNTDTPLDESSPFYRPLSLMRLAPSSTNSQPWRAIVDGTRGVDFYSRSSQPVAFIDMGIGLFHFAKGCRMEGINGVMTTDMHPVADIDGLTYVASFTAE